MKIYDDAFEALITLIYNDNFFMFITPIGKKNDTKYKILRKHFHFETISLFDFIK